jgi:hypothetical protein
MTEIHPRRLMIPIYQLSIGATPKRVMQIETNLIQIVGKFLEVLRSRWPGRGSAAGLLASLCCAVNRAFTMRNNTAVGQ